LNKIDACRLSIQSHVFSISIAIPIAISIPNFFSSRCFV
jgi:hypothetical protein